MIKDPQAPGLSSVDYNPRTYTLATHIVLLALEGHMPVSKVIADVMSDCEEVLKNLGGAPPGAKR